ncbi:hypothetical protein M8J77_012834 [Diaphorina citri]|nr:hypothetical protein M8J77_012834 [Diaphorina citri]
MVSHKTKLCIEHVYSVGYYKQLIRFHKDVGCVDEYTLYNDTWRRMRRLIECRQRCGGKDKKLAAASANKILLIGPSGSGKTFLVKTLARACAVPLVCIHGNEFSAPSPGAAEEGLAAKFDMARGLAKENKGLCIMLFEQIHELVPSSPSLSHITRLSLQLTHLLDTYDPGTGSLLFVFTSTHAHQIGNRLKTQVQLYLTAPGVEMRRTILENQLGCLKDSQLESTQENQFKSTQNQLESTRENHLESPQNQLESTREKQMKSTQENQLESTQGSRIESAQNQSAQRSLSDALKRKVIETVLPLSHSYMPVDLVRVCNTVLMYFAKHRGCTADSLLRHVRSSLSHYRPSCLKAGGLGVIDLPTAPQGRETELPFTKLNEEVELSENVQREEEGIAGENLQRGGGEEGIELREGGQRNGGEGGIGLNERVQRIGEGREERRDWEGEEEGAFVPELGGLKGVRALMEKTVEWPFKYAREFERLAIPKPKGILLYGPPGCAKTSLVRTLAAHSVYRVLAASAAQLYSPYVGEAEQNVTQLFHRARLAAPAILFIDEIDALVGNRSEVSCKDVQQSVLSVFLNEMDGVGVKPDVGGGSGGSVLVIAATNRPHLLDSALVRPGRLDKLIYVPPPDEIERRDILEKVSTRARMREDVDFEYLARATDLYSGADLCNLYREAALQSLLDNGFDNLEISHAQWLSALAKTKPSLTPKQIEAYEEFERTV